MTIETTSPRSNPEGPMTDNERAELVTTEAGKRLLRWLHQGGYAFRTDDDDFCHEAIAAIEAEACAVMVRRVEALREDAERQMGMFAEESEDWWYHRGRMTAFDDLRSDIPAASEPSPEPDDYDRDPDHRRERGATAGGKWAFFCHEDDMEWPCPSAQRVAAWEARNR